MINIENTTKNPEENGSGAIKLDKNDKKKIVENDNDLTSKQKSIIMRHLEEVE